MKMFKLKTFLQIIYRGIKIGIWVQYFCQLLNGVLYQCRFSYFRITVVQKLFICRREDLSYERIANKQKQNCK